MSKPIFAVRYGLVVILASLMVVGITACTTKDANLMQASKSKDDSTTTMSMPASSIQKTTSTTPGLSMPTSKTMTTSTVVNSLKTSAATITITGYITTEDDFASKLGADTAGMINMKMMAMSGLGITRKMDDGSWEFYFFNGTISTGGMVNGKWVFDGTGGQLGAWDIVLNVAANTPKASVPVTVTGVLNGDTMTNPGMDADGLYFPVITVSSIGQE